MSIRVFDFFSGCGGTSLGLRNAGMDIVFALDNDPVAIETYQVNFPEVESVARDICVTESSILSPLIEAQDRKQSPLLFCGCAPCQPFSKQNGNKSAEDPRRNLLSEFSRFIEYWLPEFVMIENVPGIQKVGMGGAFESFTQMLHKSGYSFDFNIVPARSFGVPQKRERLVLLASRLGSISFPEFTHGPEAGQPYSTVEEWIKDLPEIAAGEVCKSDPDHQAAKLSALNLERIRSTPEGGSRDSWPEHLLLDCHKKHKGHTDVYGRLHWKRPASGLTTRCISLSNGRFGHPEQDRALSLREAACLQTFPRSYRFCGSLADRAKQVGNAVPPLMAQTIAQSFFKVLEAR
ncbi:DNA cytosine methyltransferase [Oceanospirillum linum]|uniref:DNA cytosine methyltransferase n=1 Tax=Oceanospirillum linum TaxID=966 RepID=UPI00089F1750|nr:DNA cytosine methyltransferase [Oceanospirillum linum]SEF60033.1 DNA (cytosine-5)-methyltransferase 1 [Oleiphilus messinensis]SMP06869.1 DNA (cytosine-5)-methyltransferase 1 [Oceanospirillum linum]